MAEYVRKYWVSDGSGVTRGDRSSCEYRVYLPDLLSEREFTLQGDVAADVADAEAAIVRLNQDAATLVDTEALARLLLRAEAVASSRIEGLEIGARRLLRIEAAREFDNTGRSDVTAEEVLGNVAAMSLALDSADNAKELTVETILSVHRQLLAGTALAKYAGRIRQEQNWIGGSSYNPCSAVYVPPPADRVPDLLEDLCAFCNDDSLPSIVQAAVAHAQFETIHPFVDGNGRTGRALVHMILRRRGLAPRIVPPVSLVLATLSADYIAALTVTRFDGDSSSPEAMIGMNRWIALFAGSCLRAVADASVFEERTHIIRDTWREQIGRVRRGSSVDLLLQALPGTPILTVNGAVTLIDRSFRAVNTAISVLVEAGVLKQITVGKRNRAFEAPEVIEAFTALERQLASPDADTRTSPPVRRVPVRTDS